MGEESVGAEIALRAVMQTINESKGENAGNIATVQALEKLEKRIAKIQKLAQKDQITEILSGHY